MRDLDRSNPPAARPSTFASISAWLPLLVSLIGLGLAHGAAPDLGVADNPLCVALLGIVALSSVLVLVPRLMRWDWKARYFGLCGIYLASCALPGFVACASVVLYGSAPHAVRLLILGVYVAVHLLWCARFVVLYRKIFADDGVRATLFEEDPDAVYYMQRGDRYLLEHHFRFPAAPSGSWYAAALVAAALALLWLRDLTGWLGVPWAHVLLLPLGLPLGCLGAGGAVRAWMLFYAYPARVRREQGKEVYVDLDGTPQRPGAAGRTTGGR